MRSQLEALGDSSGRYQAIFVGLIPTGILFVGCSPLCVSRYGLIGALRAASCLGLAFVGVSLVPHLPLQLVTFVLATVYRTLIFTLHTIYVHNVFGQDSMSTILGIAFLLCAFPNACAPLITDLVATRLGGSWRLVNLASAAICVAEVVVLTAMARCCSHRRWGGHGETA